MSLRHEDPDARSLALAASLGAVALVVVIVLLQALFYFSAQREAERKALVVAPGELARLRGAQLQQLEAYRMVDASRGAVTIPIERAMAAVIRENAHR